MMIRTINAIISYMLHITTNFIKMVKEILILVLFVSLGVAFPDGKGVGFIRNAPLPLRESSNGKIIGGEDAVAGEYPFQVSIQVKPIFGDRYHNCGGIILNPTHVATAAHCLAGQILSQVSIVAGAHNMKIPESSQQIRSPKRLIWHDNFDNELLNHDCGVITLTQPLIFNEWVQPLNLSLENYNHSGFCVNTGWGNANPTGGSPILIPDALQKITLQIVEREECAALYDGLNPVHETMVCAKGSDDLSHQGSCNGDSGGPLTCVDTNGQSYLAGMVSWGMNPCGQYRYPTVFTDVGSKDVRDFIVREAARE